jgi:5-methylcytosine-specific restriction endonuclease McrA
MTPLPAVHRSNKVNLDQYRTLVLNANALPLSTTPLSLWGWKDAIEAVYKGRVQVLEEWDGPVIRSQKMSIPVPKVVMCHEYVPVAKKGVPALSRLNCALRDAFTCGYCGNRFAVKDLTFDHVVPRSKGGLSTWDNLMMACRKCNCMKGSEPANYNGIRGVVRSGNFVPLWKPRTPSWDELYKIGLRNVPTEVRNVFGNWLPDAKGGRNVPLGMKVDETHGWDDDGYWTAELEP